MSTQLKLFCGNANPARNREKKTKAGRKAAGPAFYWPSLTRSIKETPVRSGRIFNRSLRRGRCNSSFSRKKHPTTVDPQKPALGPQRSRPERDRDWTACHVFAGLAPPNFGDGPMGVQKPQQAQ